MASRTCRSSQTSIVPLRSLSKARKASRQPAWCVCDFWRETSSRRVTLRACQPRERTSGATRRRRAVPCLSQQPSRRSLGRRCGTGCRPVWAYGCPILNTRDGGGELKTLEPCHRSRPGTAPSHRRRSPPPSASRGGRQSWGSALHDQLGTRPSLAASAPGIACEAADASWRGPESIFECSSL